VIGGSNAHVIIEHPDYLVQYYKANIRSSKPEPLGENNPKRLRILKLGAKDAKSVATQLANLRKYVECRVNHLYFGNTEESLLDDLVYTFGQKRSKFPWTIAVPFSTASELALEDVKPQKAPRSEGPRIGYVFSGQGAQWYAMGRELIVEYPVFRNSLKEAEAHLRDLGATWSLLRM
jgi:acyl transferase domain-containing protein